MFILQDLVAAPLAVTVSFKSTQFLEEKMGQTKSFGAEACHHGGDGGLVTPDRKSLQPLKHL